jgi:HAD superfamily phosphoserine phosphatase-like hydrolase
MKFIFDLDGTLTTEETLPLIAREFGIEKDIAELTKLSIKGEIPFMESFINRVNLLSEIDVNQVANLLARVGLNEEILEFIAENRKECLVLTGNFSGWISILIERIGCEVISSSGYVNDSNRLELTSIIKKEQIIKELKKDGEFIVYVGDGNNDAEAMKLSDVSIACGLVHPPANPVMQVADYAVYNTSALMRLLRGIKNPKKGRTVVIAAAGIGSRLGLNTTKSLLEINGTTIIEIQLKQFYKVEDLRVTVGFQAASVIGKVLSIRRDVIFALNHDYFHNKTAASIFLGARYAGNLILAVDGDLIVKPSDMQRCLEQECEFLGVSKSSSEEPIYVDLNKDGDLARFKTGNKLYEWTGPALLKQEKLYFSDGNLCDLLLQFLPIKALQIEAMDIDTYADYLNSFNKVKAWESGNQKINQYYVSLAQNIKSPNELRNLAKDSSIIDIEFIKGYGGKDKKLLDLGSGSGLIINHLCDSFEKILAVEKFEEFSAYIIRNKSIEIIISDITLFNSELKFDVITLFGVLNYFNTSETIKLYKKLKLLLDKDGVILVKNQFGIDSNVYVEGYSEELGNNYYSEYRSVEHEKNIISKASLQLVNVYDIYPKEYNRWQDTHFYALEIK